MIKSIILYCISTKTTSKHRNLVPITRRYSEEEKAYHAEIVKLRDDVVAHYGPGIDHAHGFWVKEALVLSIFQDNLSIRYPWVNTNYRQETFSKLYELISRAKEEISFLIKQSHSELLNEIANIIQKNDIYFISHLNNSKFNPYDFFISDITAQNFFETLRGGPEFQTVTQTPGGQVK